MSRSRGVFEMFRLYRLNEMHPLYETVDWRDISRCFFCCRIKDKIKKRFSESQNLIKAIIDLDETSSDEEY